MPYHILTHLKAVVLVLNSSLNTFRKLRNLVARAEQYYIWTNHTEFKSETKNGHSPSNPIFSSQNELLSIDSVVRCKERKWSKGQLSWTSVKGFSALRDPCTVCIWNNLYLYTIRVIILEKHKYQLQQPLKEKGRLCTQMHCVYLPASHTPEQPLHCFCRHRKDCVLIFFLW